MKVSAETLRHHVAMIREAHHASQITTNITRENRAAKKYIARETARFEATLAREAMREAEN